MAGLLPLLATAANLGPGSAGAPRQAGGLVPPAEADFVHERLASLQAGAAVRSADGRIHVAGSGLNASGKFTLLHFVEDVRTRAGRLLGVSFEGPDFSIGVNVRAGARDAPATLGLRVDVGRDPAILMTIRNPETLDAPYMAERLCTAFLAVDAMVARRRVANGAAEGETRDCTPYPGWFGAGVARLLDIAVRQADAESVFARWSVAELPCFEVLAADFSPYAAADVAVAAQLVAWFLDSPERRQRYEQLRGDLAEGRTWMEALPASVAGLGTSPLVADALWDAWLLTRRWTVLTPGTTHPALVARTRDQVRVWPGTPGTPLGILPLRKPLEPSELIARRSEPWIGVTAVMKVAAMQRLGGGRDEAYRRVAEAYAAFFAALQRGSSEALLRRRLSDAEALLAELEDRLRK